MVIADFDTLHSVFSPAKTDAPLVVDPNAVLPDPIAFKCFEAVGWQTCRVFEPCRRGENRQSAARLIVKGAELFDTLSGQEPRCPLVAAALDHGISYHIIRYTSNV